MAGRARGWILLVALVAWAATLLVPGPARAGADEDLARQLLDATDDVYRGRSSHGFMTMQVRTARWERTLEMEVWSKGEDRSLIRILSPAREAGVATLKVGDNIWNYLPKIDRTMKVPASMMGGSWMGSHFTNDDLVKESRMADDYTFRIVERPEDGGGRYVVECTPKPEAPVVWGKVVVTLDGASRLPLEVTYWDEDGALARTLTFSEVVEVGDRRYPSRMKLVPADKPGEFTEIRYRDMEFDVDVPDTVFSLQALKR